MAITTFPGCNCTPPISSSSLTIRFTYWDRTFVAQHFFHTASDQVRIILQPCHLVRMAEQVVDAVSDQISSGFVSAEEKHDALCIQLVLGEYFSVLFYVEQEADEIVCSMLAPVRHNLTEIVRQTDDCLLCRRRLLNGAPGISDKCRDGV